MASRSDASLQRTALALGAAIRAQRIALGWSQDKLAEEARTSRQTVSALENAGAGNIATLAEVVDALKLKELPLFGRRVELRSAVSLHGAGDRRMQQLLSAAARAIDAAQKLVGAPSEATRVPIHQSASRGEVVSFPTDILAPPIGVDVDASSLPLRPPQPHLDTDDWVEIQIDGRVAAGPPIDYEAVETTRVPPDQAPAAEWKVLEAWGDSMIEFGVQAGDLVYVEPRKGGVAATEEIVIGWLNDGLVIKKWEQRKKRRFLHSGNDAYAPREITADDFWELRAIVRKVVQRKPRTIDFPDLSGRATKRGTP